MIAAIIVLGIVAIVAVVSSLYQASLFVTALETLDQRQANERHTLTNRIQAPQMVPVSGASGHRPPTPPKDAKEYASIGVVKHNPPRDG